MWDLSRTAGPATLRDDEMFFSLLGISTGIRFPAYSPDGKLLADATSEHTIKLWDTTTGKRLRVLTGHTDSISCESFSSDGKLLASAGSDQTVRLWAVESGEQLQSMAGHSGPVNVVAFSPDAAVIASGSDDHSIKLWSVTGKELRTLTGHQGSVRSLAFSPDGKTLASIAADATIRLWEVETGKEKASLSYSSDLLDFSGAFGVFADAVRSVAFSPDGKLLAAGFGSKAIGLWDAVTGQPIRLLKGHTGSVGSVAFSPDSRRLVSASSDRQIKLWDVTTGKEICTLVVLDPKNGEWAVVTPDGRFDTNNLDRVEDLHWVLPSAPFTPRPLEIFMRDYYEPRLLSRLLDGETLRSVPDLSKLNQTQPQVAISAIVPASGKNDLVTVTVRVEQGKGDIQRDAQGRPLLSEVHDVRLFRDGQLVGYSPGSKIDLVAGAAELKFPVRLPQNIPFKDGKRAVEFSAYAFNVDRVKSETARREYDAPMRPIVIGAQAGQASGPRAYVISVGVNAYENPEWNLKYAANDARQMEQTLSEKLGKGGQYQEVVTVPLISDYQTQNQMVASEKTATKANIKAVLDLLAGREVPVEIAKQIPNASKLRRATPDDFIIITFSSHGYADSQGNFFLIPYDVGPGSKRTITGELLKHCISSDELGIWLRDIDAGEMVLIVDACHSAASVEGEGFKPGPMGSRGLGQLSYDKGIRILTSTQSDDVALETEFTQEGLLTYALTHDGLNAGAADFKPPDGTIMLDEWLAYGSERVPSLYRDIAEKYQSLALNALRSLTIGQSGTRVLIFSRDPGANSSLKKESYQQPALFDFTRGRKTTVLATTK